jgi:Flp pilus assembly pilin Flp
VYAVKNLIVRFVREDAGQDLIEYGLLVGVITIGTIVILGTLGGHIVDLFTAADGKVAAAAGK